MTKETERRAVRGTSEAGRLVSGKLRTASPQPLPVPRQAKATEGRRKTSVFLSRETGISGNFVGRIKGAKCPLDLQFLTWDFS